MLQIQDTIVSFDVLERRFLCDLAKCKGECCIEGDCGAPLEDDEIPVLERLVDVVWDQLSDASKEVIKKQGVWYTDPQGDKEKSYLIPYGLRIVVEDGESVVRGQALTEGLRKPTDIIRLDGTDAASLTDAVIRASSVQKCVRACAGSLSAPDTKAPESLRLWRSRALIPSVWTIIRGRKKKACVSTSRH